MMMLALSILAMTLALVQSGPLCPYVCDHCKVMMASKSSFTQNCGQFVSPDMRDSMRIDCVTYQKNGEFQDFLNNMHLICDQKNQPFDDPECECSVCVELMKQDSNFMMNCGRHLSTDDILTTSNDCVMYASKGQTDDFLKNLYLMCDQKDKPFSHPCKECEDDLCAMLFLPTSDFMKKCGNKFGAHRLKRLYEDCQRHKCEGWFEDRLERLCGQAGAPLFLYPLCGDVCLYPFGELFGDLMGPTNNNVAYRVALDVAVGFFGTYYKYLYLCENGFLTFTQHLILGPFYNSYYAGQYDCYSHAYTDATLYGLLPFWVDLDVQKSNASRIWYRETKDPVLLERAKNEVIKNFDPACSSGFEPKSLFIVTWYLVKPWTTTYYDEGLSCYSHWYGEYYQTHCYSWPRPHYDDSFADTFQAVVISGGFGDDTYVMFIYEQIEWTRTYWTHPVVGIYAGPAVRIKWPPHGEEDALKLLTDSNINNPGCYMYKITDTDVQDPQCNSPP